MSSEPVCAVIVFCDLTVVEQNTGKDTLVGTFGHLTTAHFPFFMPRFFVHVAIENITPTDQTINIAVNLKHLQTGGVVGSTAFPMTLAAHKGITRARFNLDVPLHKISFPGPGAYECEVQLDGERIGSRILEILQATPPQPPLQSE